jgi:hypothetical protein
MQLETTVQANSETDDPVKEIVVVRDEVPQVDVLPAAEAAAVS